MFANFVRDRRVGQAIDDAIDVLLPEEKPDLAWRQLAELERSSSLLKRDVQTVDLRLPDRLVLRVTGVPAPQVAPPKRTHAGKPA